MGFWTLQDEDMQKPVYLMPHILKLSRTQARWADVLEYKRRTHILMLAVSVLFGLLVTVSGAVTIGASVSLAVHSYTPHHVMTGIMYALVGIFLLYAAVRILQSCARLTHFLRQSTDTGLE